MKKWLRALVGKTKTRAEKKVEELQEDVKTENLGKAEVFQELMAAIRAKTAEAASPAAETPQPTNTAGESEN